MKPLSLLSACLVSLPALAGAQDLCEDVAKPLSGQRLLRRMSLDLRDTVPSRDEVEAQTGADDVDEVMVEQFLSSSGFTHVMRRYHEALLWPNIALSKAKPARAMNGSVSF